MKYYALRRQDNDKLPQFKIYTLKAEGIFDAMSKIEQEDLNGDTSTWIMTPTELKDLRRKLNRLKVVI